MTSLRKSRAHYQPWSQPRRRRPGTSRLVCVNCGSEGHILRECSAPTTSFGIIAIRKNHPGIHRGPLIAETRYTCLSHAQPPPSPVAGPAADEKHGYLFLMVQRKDTMGFIDFIRGRYPPEQQARRRMIHTYFSEMTCEERQKLRTESFSDIWDNLWRNHSSKSYIGEFLECKRKYDEVDVQGLLDQTECHWYEQEYGFPKGRKNIRETDEACALREFCEESGYRRHELRLLPQEPLEENFRGTNGVMYRHVYFMAEIPRHVGKPRMDYDNLQQSGEIRNVSWFTLDECLATIRPYDVAKKDMLIRAHDRISGMCGCV
jgi:8-oxo-dGTP pyrophosphatase MutT (NUDIX family)